MAISQWNDVEKLADHAYDRMNEKFQNHNRALEYYLEAFELGSPTAALKIGRIYIDYMCFESDKEKAIEYFNFGLERNDVRCLVDLGTLYAETDFKKTLEYFLQYLNSKEFRSKLYHENIDVEMNISTIYHIIYLYYMEKSVAEFTPDEFSTIYKLLLPYKDLIVENIYKELECLNHEEDFSVIGIYSNRLDYIKSITV